MLYKIIIFYNKIKLVFKMVSIIKIKIRKTNLKTFKISIKIL